MDDCSGRDQFFTSISVLLSFTPIIRVVEKYERERVFGVRLSLVQLVYFFLLLTITTRNRPTITDRMAAMMNGNQLVDVICFMSTVTLPMSLDRNEHGCQKNERYCKGKDLHHRGMAFRDYSESSFRLMPFHRFFS